MRGVVGPPIAAKNIVANVKIGYRPRSKEMDAVMVIGIYGASVPIHGRTERIGIDVQNQIASSRTQPDAVIIIYEGIVLDVHRGLRPLQIDAPGNIGKGATR